MLPTMKITGYTIEGQIGQGGMSRVYRAIQDSLGRPVALKIMNPVFADDPAFSERFLDEGRLLASLQHPHIVTIYDIGVSDGFHYISMEYVDGGDLRQHIRNGMSSDAALGHVSAIGSGLTAAHDAHIVHRDVKPANILFRPNGTLLLTDFGIAKKLATNKGLTVTGSMVGSPYYLSPEQALGRPIDGRADIYSLGIVLYEMLAGEKPFEGDSEIDIAMKHIEGELPRLPQNLSHFQPLLDRMTAKQPDDRFSDMISLLQAVERLRETGSWTGAETMFARDATQGLKIGNDRSHASDRVAAITDDSPAAEKTLLLAHHRQDAPDRSGDELPSDAGSPVSRLWSEFRDIISGHIMKFAAVAGVLAVVGVLIAGGLARDKEETILPKSTSSKPAQPIREASLTRKTEPDTQLEINRQAELEKQAEGAGQTGTPRQTSDGGLSTASPAHSANSTDEPIAVRSSRLVKQTELAKQAKLTKQAEMNELLKSAQTALSKYRLTTPVYDSAYYYYQKVLERDPENVTAAAGLLQIADRYLTLAKTAFDRGQDKKAKHYVELGLRVKNNHPGLLAFRNRLMHQDQRIDKTVNQFFRSVKRIFK